MEASPARPHTVPTFPSEKIKQKLLKHGIHPSPKILHTLRKKHLRKSKRHLPDQTQDDPSLSSESHFQTLKSEYKAFTKAINVQTKHQKNNIPMIGKPWERLERIEMRELASGSNEYSGEGLKSEYLMELSGVLEKESQKFGWLLEDDVEMIQEEHKWVPPKRRGSDSDAIQFLVNRLSSKEMSVKDWKFGRMMNQSGLQFTEGQMLRIVGGLGDGGQWRHALSVVEWVYTSKEHKNFKSRFVYTKVLAVLGKARRPHEALKIFNFMRADYHIYPDMAAYHSIAVTLGQAGLVKELLKVIESMKQKPSRKVNSMRRKNWDPVLQPDVVVFNAVMNACVPSRQWRGVSWVFEQLRKSGLKPNGATYGLAMEENAFKPCSLYLLCLKVMVQSGKYELVHEYFGRMKRSGEVPKALTYKVVVKSLWKEGKVNEAVEVVRDMEQKGVVGAACVYYELACCLCNNGRWQEAILEIEKLKRLPRSKPLEVTYTGMILSSMDGGYIDDCISIFEHSKEHCNPGVGIINAMLRVYGRNDMFIRAKTLFEDTKSANSSSLNLDSYTYSSMLEASARALQWEYFEYVYKEMVLLEYQLDQSKHASLLVEASRAGKGNLLEHAFDLILEAGEIPYPSIFTEMVCQATAQDDYERAVTIVNTLAHAPFQVHEKQWLDLFQKNRDRINIVSLKKLLDRLEKCDLSTEASVSNLSRSLQTLCSYCNMPPEEYNKKFDAAGSVYMPNVLSVNCESNGREDKLASDMENSEVDLASIESSDFLQCRSSKCFELGNLEDEGDDAFKLDMSNSEVSDFHRSYSPSAVEILESWKENMRKDGIFFPFQLDGK